MWASCSTPSLRRVARRELVMPPGSRAPLHHLGLEQEGFLLGVGPVSGRRRGGVAAGGLSWGKARRRPWPRRQRRGSRTGSTLIMAPPQELKTLRVIVRHPVPKDTPGPGKLGAAREVPLPAPQAPAGRRRGSRALPARPGRLRPLAHVAAVRWSFDETHGLHERVDRGRPDEREAPPLQVLGQRHRLGRGRHLHRAPPGSAARARRRRSGSKPQTVGGERTELVAQLERPPRVVDRRLDLAAVAHDARVAQQPSHVARRRSGRPWRSRSPRSACRKASRLRRMVSQDRPAWKPSRQSFSKSRRSSATGKPHSRSW